MISPETVQQIGDWLNNQAVNSGIEFQLREQYPDLHFTFCSDDDVVTDNPVYEQDAFNLYLIDSSDHCLCFTQDMDVATGIVIAEIEED